MDEQDTPKKQCTGPCGRTLDATFEHFEGYLPGRAQRKELKG